MQAVEAIIESKVYSNKNRLSFLNKYTTGKANETVKGFVALNNDDGYKEAKNLLAERFGNPYHVAEGYKSQLREWPKVRDGDSAGTFWLSDPLQRSHEVYEIHGWTQFDRNPHISQHKTTILLWREMVQICAWYES